MRYLLVILLMGCGGQSSSDKKPEEKNFNSTYILYGDSRCVGNYHIQSRDCVAGRKLVDMDRFDESYDIIIIHLGFNDMRTIPPELWRGHLEYLIHGFESKVWCVLPTWANFTHLSQIVAEYRRAMSGVCVNTVDPQIEGYLEDRIHYADENYLQVLSYVDGIRTHDTL